MENIPEGYDSFSVQQYTPQQMQYHRGQSKYIGNKSYLARLAGGDESAFAESEAPAMRQFQEMQGQMASRFSGMGLGGRHSSGFQNSMTQAGSDFAQDLASKRQQMRMQAIQELMGYTNQFLNQKPYEKGLVGGEKSKPNYLGMGGAVIGGVASGGNPAAIQAGYTVGTGANSFI